ncbi:MAG: hypothetical protein ACE5JI_16220 [Acidobacteriota bacterium]
MARERKIENLVPTGGQRLKRVPGALLFDTTRAVSNKGEVQLGHVW